MVAVTVRNLTAETYRALKLRAARNGRSTEAEIRDILEAAARPPERVKLGSLLAEIGRESNLSEADWAAFDAATSRDGSQAEPITFDR